MLKFDSLEQMDKYVESENYGEEGRICWGLYFDQKSDDDWKINMRYNITIRRSRSDLYRMSDPRIRTLGLQNLLYLQKMKFSGKLFSFVF